jgi:hypothetical protein
MGPSVLDPRQAAAYTSAADLEGAFMIFRSMRGTIVLAVLFAGACQTYQAVPASTPMDGVWASTDGVFVASFDRGSFTSRFTATNEILAQGSYSVAASTVSMQWISVATQQRRSANCTFTAADVVACSQDGGGSFELRRGAANASVPVGAEAPTGVPETAPGPQG